MEQVSKQGGRGATKKPFEVSKESCKAPWRNTVTRLSIKRSCETILKEKSEGGKSRAYTAIPSFNIYTSQCSGGEKRSFSVIKKPTGRAPSGINSANTLSFGSISAKRSKVSVIPKKTPPSISAQGREDKK